MGNRNPRWGGWRVAPGVDLAEFAPRVCHPERSEGSAFKVTF